MKTIARDSHHIEHPFQEKMLKKLQFSIHFTSPYRFLQRFLSLKPANEMEKNFALFMLEGSLI